MSWSLRLMGIHIAHPVVHGLAASLAAAACHGTNQAPPQSAAYAPLPMVSKAEVPPYCQFLGAVTSTRRSDEAYEDIQYKAAERGATNVVLDGTRASGLTWGYRIRSEVVGRAYWCPPPPSYGTYGGPPAPPPPPAAAVPPPAPAVLPASMTQESGNASCTPACAAGYACVARACVPSCNPPCAAGLVCSSDRVCRSR